MRKKQFYENKVAKLWKKCHKFIRKIQFYENKKTNLGEKNVNFTRIRS